MSRKQPFNYDEFKSIYSRIPRLCVDVVLKHENGILMTLRQHESWKNQWHFPGGTVMYRESLEDAVKRIADEELGIQVDISTQLPAVEIFSEEQERGFGYSVGIPILCSTDEQLPQKSKDNEAVKIFTEVPENVVQEHGVLLAKILKGEYESR